MKKRFNSGPAAYGEEGSDSRNEGHNLSMQNTTFSSTGPLDTDNPFLTPFIENPIDDYEYYKFTPPVNELPDLKDKFCCFGFEFIDSNSGAVASFLEESGRRQMVDLVRNSTVQSVAEEAHAYLRKNIDAGSFAFEESPPQEIPIGDKACVATRLNLITTSISELTYERGISADHLIALLTRYSPYVLENLQIKSKDSLHMTAIAVLTGMSDEDFKNSLTTSKNKVAEINCRGFICRPDSTTYQKDLKAIFRQLRDRLGLSSTDVWSKLGGDSWIKIKEALDNSTSGYEKIIKYPWLTPTITHYYTFENAAIHYLRDFYKVEDSLQGKYIKQILQESMESGNPFSNKVLSAKGFITFIDNAGREYFPEDIVQLLINDEVICN